MTKDLGPSTILQWDLHWGYSGFAWDQNNYDLSCAYVNCINSNLTPILNTLKTQLYHINGHMWHDQGEWVTCRQYLIFIFQYKSLVHLKCYILIQTHLNRTSGCRDTYNSLKLLNNVKHANMSPLLDCNSKSIFPTSDSFSWSCHIFCLQ